MRQKKMHYMEKNEFGNSPIGKAVCGIIMPTYSLSNVPEEVTCIRCQKIIMEELAEHSQQEKIDNLAVDKELNQEKIDKKVRFYRKARDGEESNESKMIMTFRSDELNEMLSALENSRAELIGIKIVENER